MKKQQPTIVDIANELNIAPSTVSKALSNHPKISDKTKLKVAEVVKALGYRKNVMASGLRKGKSGLIGAMVPWINLNFFATAIKGIEDATANTRYNILIGQSKDSYEIEKRQVDAFIDAQVEGIVASISSATTDFSHFEKAMNLGIKIVLFDREVSGLEVNQVLIDDHKGALDATNHFIKKGYKRIGLISGPSKILSYKKRIQGYKEALELNGFEVDESIILEAPTNVNSGKDLALKMLDLPNPPDAIFCLSDVYALGAMKSIKEKGLKVPNDIGLIGFSNEEFTTLVSPSISTIDQFSENLGNISGKTMIEALDSEDEVKTIQKLIIKPQLIQRESTDLKK